MQRHSRGFWEEQLREYWDSGFTVSEYSELIGQSRWKVGGCYRLQCLCSVQNIPVL